MLILDKEETEKLQRHRSEVMKLGITEDLYNKMISNANVWLSQAMDVYLNTLSNMTGSRFFMSAALGPVVNMGLQQLEYCARLIHNVPADDDDMEHFAQDRQQLLLALREDFIHLVPQGKAVKFIHN